MSKVIIPDGAISTGHLVFQNTTSRKNAVYVIRLWRTTLDLDLSSDVHWYIETRWGTWVTYIDKGIEALQGRVTHLLWTNITRSTISDLVHHRLNRGYEFRPEHSFKLPFDIALLYWPPEPAKPSAAPKAVEASLKKHATFTPTWKPRSVPVAPEPAKPTDPGTIAGFLEL